MKMIFCGRSCSTSCTYHFSFVARYMTLCQLAVREGNASGSLAEHVRALSALALQTRVLLAVAVGALAVVYDAVLLVQRVAWSLVGKTKCAAPTAYDSGDDKTLVQRRFLPRCVCACGCGARGWPISHSPRRPPGASRHLRTVPAPVGTLRSSPALAFTLCLRLSQGVQRRAAGRIRRCGDRGRDRRDGGGLDAGSGREACARARAARPPRRRHARLSLHQGWGHGRVRQRVSAPFVPGHAPPTVRLVVSRGRFGTTARCGTAAAGCVRLPRPLTTPHHAMPLPPRPPPQRTPTHAATTTRARSLPTRRPRLVR